MNFRRATDADFTAVVTLQHAAYAANRAVLGVEPLPLKADYAEIFRTMEVWLVESTTGLDGVLILEARADDLLIWSVATPPDRQSRGIGRQLIEMAEIRAAELGRSTMRLYTGTLLKDRVAWYGRHGYQVERVDVLPDRSVTHMVKRLGHV